METVENDGLQRSCYVTTELSSNSVLHTGSHSPLVTCVTHMWGAGVFSLISWWEGVMVKGGIILPLTEQVLLDGAS